MLNKTSQRLLRSFPALDIYVLFDKIRVLTEILRQLGCVLEFPYPLLLMYDSLYEWFYPYNLTTNYQNRYSRSLTK